MLALIGLVVGALLGHALWGEWGTILGGLAGFFAGVTLAGNRQRALFRKPDGAMASPLPSGGTGPDAALRQRVAQLEARVASLEAALSATRTGTVAEAGEREGQGGEREGRAGERAPVAGVPAPAPGASEAIPGFAGVEPRVVEPPPGGAATEPAPAATSASGAAHWLPAAATGPSPSQRLWAWLVGGNALTRVGVVVLFFGVAFLLRWFAERFTVPIELRLGGVAVAGIALIGLGLGVARSRPGYGLSLQGAGAGVLYLTIYAALRLYALLPDVVAAALLAAVAALTVALAVRADSQALAGLAVAGAFLAPLLAATDGPPLPLFGYVAIVNGVIFALAWRHAWRALNALGFVCTFGLGLFWGQRYYASEHFATVEPFLLLFFASYVTIAILEARRGAFEAKHPVDGLLVFGVPLAGFVLQAALVADHRYGAAWSALAVAGIYAALFAALRRSAVPALALLARAFLALAVVFVTLAIPLAFDDEWTAALWAIEAAGVYWLGVRQDSALARGFALLVQGAAGLAFLLSGGPSSYEPLFANGHFIGAIVIALSGFATAFCADRAGAALPAPERPVTAVVLAWAAAWWLGGGVAELVVHLDWADEGHAALLWVVAAAGTALALARVLAWPRLAAVGMALLPAMVAAAAVDFHRERTTLLAWGWLLWPVAWAVQAFALRAAEAGFGAGAVEGGTAGAAEGGATGAGAASAPAAMAPGLRAAHAFSAVALTAQLSWEASEWVGRTTPAHTAWMACAAALPAIAFLAVASRCAGLGRWPFARYGQAWSHDAGRVVMALLVAWFAVVNVLSPGDATPLPYLPLANPLELTLALALATGFAWSRRILAPPVEALYGGLGLGLFALLNGVVLRTAHHWAHIPWRLSSLLASKPLQAALTLTWTTTALALMFVATRRRLRPLWMVGAALLAVVVGKLFLVDLSALSGLPRVVAFLGVGVLMLAIGYLSPLPPSRDPDAPR